MQNRTKPIPRIMSTCLRAFLLLLFCVRCSSDEEIRRLTSGLVVTTIVGSGTSGTGGGIGTSAQLDDPHDVKLSISGNYAFIADFDNHAIRRYEFSSGNVIFFAGSTSASSGTDDGTGTSARFNLCKAIVMHPSGDYFFVSDQGNHRIRKVMVATGVVTTIAGSTSGQTDGTGTSAQFNDPWGIVIDSAGTFLIVTSTNRIRRIALPSYDVTTVAGAGPGYKNSVGTSAQFFGPSGLAMSPDDSYILVADRENHVVRKIELHNNKVTLFCGQPSTSGHVDGDCDSSAMFQSLVGISFSADGSYVLIGGGLQNTIRKIDVSSRVASTLAGSTTAGSSDGELTSASFKYPVGFAVSSDGSFALVADKSNHLIRHIMLVEPTASPTFAPTFAPTISPTASPTTREPTSAPTSQPTSIPSSNPSAVPTLQPTEFASAAPTSFPSSAPTSIPSSVPTTFPTAFPTSIPTGIPTTSFPSSAPTSIPSSVPTTFPTAFPTSIPTGIPSSSPSSAPTSIPSAASSSVPTSIPSGVPTTCPTKLPTSVPITTPSAVPTSFPSNIPTSMPSGVPATWPTFIPTAVPSSIPTEVPTSSPLPVPTSLPSATPSSAPTSMPSGFPSASPTSVPTSIPTCSPTSLLTPRPSSEPTAQPTPRPSFSPTALPSSSPTPYPTSMPSSIPTLVPSAIPSGAPTLFPSSPPSALPTSIPTVQPPSLAPSLFHAAAPTSIPTSLPTAFPTSIPSAYPTATPSSVSTSSPTQVPTASPTAFPTSVPTSSPSNQPTHFPTSSETFSPVILNDISFQGFIIRGSAIHGSSLTASSLGDVNGDGVDDIVVGCPFYNGNVGSAYVIFGKYGGNADISLRAMNHIIGFAVFGNLTGGLFGYSVSSAGDIDGDGIGDMIFGAPYGNEGSGVVYIIYGVLGYRNDVYIRNLKLTTGFAVRGSSFGGNTGLFLAHVGDVTGDGLSDILISEPYSSNMRGATYLTYGKSRTERRHITLSSSGDPAYAIFRGSASNARSGFEIASVGDVNGDGIQDFAIGESHMNEFITGIVRVIFGCSYNCYDDVIILSELGIRGYSIMGTGKYAKFGMVIRPVGDLNDDGYSDILLGSIAGGNFRGVVYVIYGKASSIDLDLASFRVTDGFSITGNGMGNFGAGAVGDVDINHDSKLDFIVMNAYSVSGEVGYAIVDTKMLRGGGSRGISDMTSHHMFPIFNPGYNNQRMYSAGDMDNNGFRDFVVTVTDGDVGLAYVVYDIYDSGPEEPVSHSPVVYPTKYPTFRPSFVPSIFPTNKPTLRPTAPTCKPTSYHPTRAPTVAPSISPTFNPTRHPTNYPSRVLSPHPTEYPTPTPATSAPSSTPTSGPTSAPNLSQHPTSPTLNPTLYPTLHPTFPPTAKPTVVPTPHPSLMPSLTPTFCPTYDPTSSPTFRPSSNPTLQPSFTPTLRPTTFPTNRRGFAIIQVTTCEEYLGSFGNDWFIVSPGDKCSLNISGNGGRNVFAIMPSGESSVIIKDFNLLNDRLDLSAFTEITSFGQLNMTRGSVLIHLQAGQMIVLLHHDPSDIRPEHFVFASVSSSSSSNVNLATVMFIVLLGLLSLCVGSMLKERLDIECFPEDVKGVFISDEGVPSKIAHRKAFVRVLPTANASKDATTNLDKCVETEMKENRDRCETYDSYFHQDEDSYSSVDEEEIQHQCNYALYLLSQRRCNALGLLDDSTMPSELVLDVSSESDGRISRVNEAERRASPASSLDESGDISECVSENDASVHDTVTWRDLSTFHIPPRRDHTDESYCSGSSILSIPIKSQVSSESDLVLDTL